MAKSSSIIDAAIAEVDAEEFAKNKEKIKSKYREIKAAKKVLANLEGELQVLLADVTED